jgi:NAD(P)-dependent dehydrogenase (short-subunit alcohol dehydrogenase family)
VLGLTRTDAVAYARDGIRVNAILPGFIKTPSMLKLPFDVCYQASTFLYFAVVEESIRRGANYEDLIDSIPIGRWGNPNEIAEAIVFFSSEKASLITGADLCIDGAKMYAV